MLVEVVVLVAHTLLPIKTNTTQSIHITTPWLLLRLGKVTNIAQAVAPRVESIWHGMIYLQMLWLLLLLLLSTVTDVLDVSLHVLDSGVADAWFEV